MGSKDFQRMSRQSMEGVCIMMTREQQLEELYQTIEESIAIVNAMPEKDEIADRIFQMLQEMRDTVYDALEPSEQ